MRKLIDLFLDFWNGKPLGSRSSGWNDLRKRFIEENPACAMCGGKKRLQVHHIYPFHIFPEFELDWNNLITLCGHCHLEFGHLGSFRSYNISIKEDAEYWRKKIAERPR